MIDTATLILQYRAVAIQGLLRHCEVTIDLPRIVVPLPEDGPLPKELDRTTSMLATDGLAAQCGLCISMRPEIHGGIIRRFILRNRPAAKAELDRLTTALGSAYPLVTDRQFEAAKPRGLHLLYEDYRDGRLLFNPFPDPPPSPDSDNDT